MNIDRFDYITFFTYQKTKSKIKLKGKTWECICDVYHRESIIDTWSDLTDNKKNMNTLRRKKLTSRE